ncbi:unnamed protein product [Urochloa humidicola]
MAAEHAAATGGEPPPSTPQPAEGVTSAAAGHRSVPTPFLSKTYQLVDDPAVDDVISWNDDGSAFVVWRPAEFARDLLPKYFKHNNFSSFVRQLNTYGFRKIVPDRWEFANDCFRRGEKRLLRDIHRRKVTPTAAATGTAVTGLTAAAAVAAAIPMALPVGSPVYSGEEQVLSSSSSPEPPSLPSGSGSGSGAAASGGDVGEENDRLRRENARLARELGQMKKLCNNILLLMSKYAATQSLDAAAQQVDAAKAAAAAAATAAGNCSGESSDAAVTPPPPPPPLPSVLELLPSCRGAAAAEPPEAAGTEHDDDKAGARLFGVSIGRKRVRDEACNGDTGGVDDPVSRSAAEVKAEPADAPPEPDHHHQRHHHGATAEPQAWPIYRPRPVYHPLRASCNGSAGSGGAGSDHDGSNSR